MTDSLKRKIKTRTMHEKYEILKEINRGSSSTSVVKNYNIPKQTLFHLVNDKNKNYTIVEINSSV